ncbi:hypothetical protein PVAP13_3NG076402 [Panicum virgatum]|uniref:Uncharacterized protein n=1 Tax=Panicum virgatum TaxID=38727 RepID=A0A8T0UG47_PANVG|nr:hypothetical protein PVAP13_3NG076402 [Panicum virgatum]
MVWPGARQGGRAEAPLGVRRHVRVGQRGLPRRGQGKGAPCHVQRAGGGGGHRQEPHAADACPRRPDWQPRCAAHYWWRAPEGEGMCRGGESSPESPGLTNQWSPPRS